MAGKKQSDYRYNAKISMRNLMSDLYSSYFPNTKSALDDVRSGYKVMADSKTNTGFTNIKSKIRNYPLFKFTSDLTKAAFEGLRTGKFYQSEDEIFGFDDSFFDSLENDSFFFDDTGSADDNSDVQRATLDEEKEVRSDKRIFGAVEGLAKSLTGKVSTTGNATIKATIEGLYATAASINNTIVSSSADIKSQMLKHEMGLSAIHEKVAESLSATQKQLAIQTETLTEIKQMREMTGDYMIPKINEKPDTSERGVPEWYTALKKGDFMAGFKDILAKSSRAVDMQKSQGVFSMIQSAVPMIMMMSGGNPFSLVKNFFLEPWLDKKFGLQDFANRVDKKIKSLPDLIDAGARTASLSENDTIRAIGEALRTQKDMTSSVATDRYDKGGRVFFDGMTREAIVNVIPTYLSSIVSLLSGKERTTYDYDKGMFRSMTDIKNTFFEKMPKLEFEYERLSNLIEKTLSDEDKEGLDKARLDQYAKVIMERLAEKNYTLSNFKDHSYSKALETLRLTENEMSESDFLKLRSVMSNLETNEETFTQFSNLDRAMVNYLRDRNEFMKESAKTARRTGVISSLNNSWIMDNGSAVGLKNIMGGGQGTGTGTQAPVEAPTYKHLLADIGKANVGTIEANGNLFGTTLSPEEIQIVNDYTNDNLSGLFKFRGAISQNVRLALQSTLFKKLGVEDEQWYKDLIGTSHYNINDIIGNKKFLDSLVNSTIEEAELNSRLEIMGISEEGQERIREIITDPNITDEERTKAVQEELSKSSFVNDFKLQMENRFKEAQSAVQEAVSDIKNDTTSSKAGEYIANAKAKYQSVATGVKEFMNEKFDEFKNVTAKGKEKTQEFYENNKTTINNLTKATLGVGLGYGFLKALGRTGLGHVIGTFGLMSPIAIGAGALGAGIYAYKTNLYDRLFGTSEQAQRTKEKTMSIMKTSVFSAGLVGASSLLKSLLIGGSMMSPVSMALTGLAVGILGENKGFKKMLFGTEEGSFMSNLKIWMIGDKETGKEGILTRATKGISSYFKEGFGKMNRWFQKDIWEPLSETFKPINNFINTTANKLFGVITGIPTTLENSLFKNIRTNLTQPLMQKFDDAFIKPVGGFLKKIFGGAGSFLGKIISAPFKFFRTLITGETESSKFAGSFGSDSKGVQSTSEYKASMKTKRELYERTKYMSVAEAEKTLSGSELKQFRKFRAEEAAKKKDNSTEEVQEAKSLDERLKAYKESKKNETGKGISTDAKRFYKQTDMPRRIRTLDTNYAGCGLASLATAIAIVTDAPVKPEELIAESFGYTDEMRNGITPSYMMNVLREMRIPATLIDSLVGLNLETHIKNGGVLIAELHDFMTDELHFVTVYDFDGKEYIYSDPARTNNMRTYDALLTAKFRRGILVFTPKGMAKTTVKAPNMIEEAFNILEQTSDKYITRATEVYGDTKLKVTNTMNTAKTQATKMYEDAKAGVKRFSNIADGIIRQTLDSYEDKKDNSTEEVQEAKSLVSSRKRISQTISDGVTQAAKDREDKKSAMYKLVKGFKEDLIDLLEQTHDDMLVQTQGVSYNAEYIKRILVNQYGEVEDFGNQDVVNRTFSGIKMWFKRKYRQAKRAVKNAGSWIYDNTIGRAKPIIKAIKTAYDTIVNLPKTLINGMWKIVSAFLPSKETIMSIYNGTKKLIANGYTAIKTMITDLGKGMISFMKTSFTMIGKGLKTGLDMLGKGIMGAVDKIGKAVEWGFDTIGKAANFLVDRAGKVINWGFEKLSQAGSWIWGKTKGAVTGTAKFIKNVLKPQEVYVRGGNLNSVQVVEVVKAVGAVDLDYAESMSRKLTPEDRANKGFKSLFKSPKFKTGQEYQIISERQDAEQQQTMLPTIINQPQEEKKDGILDKLMGVLGGKLGGVFGGIGGIIGGGIISALAAGGLWALSKTAIGDKAAEFLDSKGLDGKYDVERAGELGKRNLFTKIVKSKIGREAFTMASEKAAKLGAKALGAIDIKKGVKIITEFLEKLLKNGKVQKILGDKFCKSVMKRVPQIAAKAGTVGAKAVTKGSVRMAAYSAPPIGLILDIGFVIWDLVTGMTTDADNLFGVRQRDLTVTQRAVGGLVKALQGFLASKGPLILLALIPTDWLVQTIWQAVASEDAYNEWLEKNKNYDPAKVAEMDAQDVVDARNKEYESYLNQSDEEVKKGNSKSIKSNKSDDRKDRNKYKNVSTTIVSEPTVQEATSTKGTVRAYQGAYLTGGVSDMQAQTLTGNGPAETTTTEEVPSFSPNVNEMNGVVKLGEGETFQNRYDAEIFGSRASIFGGQDSSGIIDFFKNLFKDEEGSSGNASEDLKSRADKYKPDNRSLNKRLASGSFASQMKDMYNYAHNTWGEAAAKNFMRIAYAESEWNPTIQNKDTKAEGLFQVIPRYREAWGFRPSEAPGAFAPVDQLKRVGPQIMNKVKAKGTKPSLGNMYAALHYPVAVGKPDNWELYGRTKDPKAYKYNQGIDYNKDGRVTFSEISTFADKKGGKADAYAKQLGLQGYGDGRIEEFVSQKAGRYNKLSMGPGMSFKDAGCGPAVMAMLLDKLGISYNMEDLVSKALQMKTGAFSGTPMTYFKAILKDVGISSAIYTDRVIDRFIVDLKQGKSPILLTVSSTGSNHYIIGKELSEDGRIIINDPEKSASEAVSLSDRRLKKAKAILVYKVQEGFGTIAKSAIGDLLGGAYGVFNDISKVVSKAPKDLLRDVERTAVNSISRDGKYDVVQKIAENVVRQNVNSANNAINQVTKPITGALNEIGRVESKVNSTVRNAERLANDIANAPEKIVKQVKDKTISGAVREANRAVNDVSKLAGDVANLGNVIGKAKQTGEKVLNVGNNNGRGQVVNNAAIEKMASDIAAIKDLMVTLIEAVKSNSPNAPVIYNGKQLNTTIGGRPAPLTMGMGSTASTDSFMQTVVSIAKGQPIS